jgi:hypothetical protein
MMTIEATKEAIKVMQAFVDGKEVEQIDSEPCCGWEEVSEPLWNWDDHTYRIAKPEPVEICVGMELIGNVTGDTYIVKGIDGNYVWIKDLSTNEFYKSWRSQVVVERLHTLVNGTKRTLKAPEATK